MKRLFAVIILILSITGCSMNDVQSDEPRIEKSSDYRITEPESITAETETNPANLLSDDNIKEFDLNQPENKSYLQYKKEFSYKNEYSLPDGRKIIEDKNLYLEDLSGNKVPIIEVPEEETEKYVVFWDMIDDNRFCYYIINHETTDGSGIYNLETGEDFRIENCDDHSGYVPKKIVDNYLFFSKGRKSDLSGFGKLNLDTYEFTEIDCSPLLDNNVYYWCGPDISPDGTKAAVYGIVSKASKPNEMNEYQVAIYSLTDEKILKTYNFFSENEYINHQLLYYSDDQVYLYASQYGDNPKDFLYIFNLE